MFLRAGFTSEEASKVEESRWEGIEQGYYGSVGLERGLLKERIAASLADLEGRDRGEGEDSLVVEGVEEGGNNSGGKGSEASSVVPESGGMSEDEEESGG